MSEYSKRRYVTCIWQIKEVGNLDYVSTWYRKSAELIQNTKVEVALVSTNSITQGGKWLFFGKI